MPLFAAIVFFQRTDAASELETIRVRLESGDNLVGWLGAEQPARGLFEELPRLDAAYAWDAQAQAWLVTARDVPDSVATLQVLRPGMGLLLRLSEGEAVEWTQTVKRLRSLYRLQPGLNLVAWSGPERTALPDAAAELGGELNQAMRWDTLRHRYQTYDPDQPRTAEGIRRLRRGEAVWVDVAAPAVWLQDASVYPRVEYPGGAEEQTRAAVRRDLLETLWFFDAHIGELVTSQAFRIYIPTDFAALIAHLSDWAQSETRTLWERIPAWGGRLVMIQQSAWAVGEGEDVLPANVATMIHEYFHALQHYLSGGNSYHAAWLVEGSAVWAETEWYVVSGLTTREAERRRVERGITTESPPLRRLHLPDGGWHYSIGFLAVDELVQRFGLESMINFWREVRSAIWPYRHWSDAFAAVFDTTLGDFYREFQLTPWPLRIEGRVTTAAGAAVEDLGVSILAMPEDQESHIGSSSVVDGSFALSVDEPGTYSLLIFGPHQDCLLRHRGAGVVLAGDEATRFDLEDEPITGIQIELPAGWCEWQVSGRVLDEQGVGIAGVWVYLESADGAFANSDPTDMDASFSVTAPILGSYRLRLVVDDCQWIYGAAGVVRDREATPPLVLSNADLDEIEVWLPSRTCG